MNKWILGTILILGVIASFMLSWDYTILVAKSSSHLSSHLNGFVYIVHSDDPHKIANFGHLKIFYEKENCVVAENGELGAWVGSLIYDRNLDLVGVVVSITKSRMVIVDLFVSKSVYNESRRFLND